MARQIPPFHRTQGDGMEKIESLDAVEQTVILQPKESGELTTPDAIKEKTPLNKSLIKNLSEGIKLTPHAVDIKQKKILASLKNKEPKFVPYEPYKAAVRPIVPPTKKTIFQQAGKKKSKAYADILKIHKTTVTQENNSADAISENTASEDNWQCKLKVLESEMQTLREENEQLENQLKFQVQVNGELKNLLVAAVGEDMETKVHVLTEDKLHLAQALLRSAESLTSHQEQTEWLAGQCEVWRSKFLASSVMVEELARWKASLSHKVNEANETLRKFLDEGKQIRENVVKTHENLCKLRDNFDLHNKKNKRNFSNILELCEENFKISDTLMIELLGSKVASCKEEICLNHWKKTPAEKSAEHILANPSILQLVGEPDVACKAVVGAAINLSGQLYLQNHPPKIGCCPQCTGEIKLV